jgi:hypothetical protein
LLYKSYIVYFFQTVDTVWRTTTPVIDAYDRDFGDGRQSLSYSFLGELYITLFRYKNVAFEEIIFATYANAPRIKLKIYLVDIFRF